jgi:hypothetical protein
VVGIPVTLENFRFALVIPSARFQLKDNPGIFSFDIVTSFTKRCPVYRTVEIYAHIFVQMRIETLGHK